MSRVKPSTSASAKPAPFVCVVCGEKKSPTLFPSLTATTCSECTSACTAPQAAKNPPGRPKKLGVEPTPHVAPQNDQEPASGFVHVDAEIDPTNPTMQELAARTLARRRLLPFIQRFRPKYMAGWVHEDICRRLERFLKQVEDGLEPRLMLNVPVRHGKSEIGSRHFAPWVMGKHPDWEIIAASGSQSLALSFSRYVRDLVRDPSYQAVFPDMKLDTSSQSVENWNTMSGGGYLAAGVGTMITGRGCHILLLDDVVKDAEAADSQVIRDATWEWYMSTALTRLAPGGGVLGIMTTWNEDDWAGRVKQVMATGDGDKFEIISYPAINETGDEYILEDDAIVQIPPGAPVPKGARLTRPHNTALHPSRYTLESLRKRKANYYALGQQRWWEALYQQNPTPEGGVFFTKDMFVEYTHAPKRHGRVVLQAWDFAITEKQSSDWTVGITGLLDEYDTLYILDVWRFKTDDGIELGTAIVTYAQMHGADQIAVEDGQIWKAIKANFDKACETKKFYPSYEVIVPLTDKRVRAQPLRGRMQQGKVQFPCRAPWYTEFKGELLRFQGGGKHDDQVDAAAHLTRLATSVAAPKVKEQAHQKSWKDKLSTQLRQLGGSHLTA